MNSQRLKKRFIILLCFFLQACQTSNIQNTTDQNKINFVNSTDGVPISYSMAGNKKGKTLIFIHCLGCNITYWDTQVNYFSKTNHVVTIDLAGYGLSDSGRDNFTINMFANDIASVIDKLGLTDIILIGQSLGGAVAIETALKRAEHVSGIVSINTFNHINHWPKKSEIKATMLPYRENFYKTTFPQIKSKFAPYTNKALIYQIAKDIALTPADIGVSSLENFYQWMANNSHNAIKQLSVPLFHINSQQNAAIDNKDESITYVKTPAYFIPQETPNKFNLALDQVLTKLDSLKNNKDPHIKKP